MVPFDHYRITRFRVKLNPKTEKESFQGGLVPGFVFFFLDNQEYEVDLSHLSSSYKKIYFFKISLDFQDSPEVDANTSN